MAVNFGRRVRHVAAMRSPPAHPSLFFFGRRWRGGETAGASRFLTVSLLKLGFVPAGMAGEKNLVVSDSHIMASVRAVSRSCAGKCVLVLVLR